MEEVEFITDMQRRTGCALIIDINNVHVSGYQSNSDAYACQRAFHALSEIHLAGHAEDTDDRGEPLLIDAHDRPIAPCLGSLCPCHPENRPYDTLIEWIMKF